MFADICTNVFHDIRVQSCWLFSFILPVAHLFFCFPNAYICIYDSCLDDNGLPPTSLGFCNSDFRTTRRRSLPVQNPVQRMPGQSCNRQASGHDIDGSHLPHLGKISILTNIFQTGWNHHLVLGVRWCFFLVSLWPGGNTSVPVPMVMRRDAPQDFWHFLFQRVRLCFLLICPADEVCWDTNQLENPTYWNDLVWAIACYDIFRVVLFTSEAVFIVEMPGPCEFNIRRIVWSWSPPRKTVQAWHC